MKMHLEKEKTFLKILYRLKVFSSLHTWNDLNALSSSQATSVLSLSFGNILHLHRNHHGTDKVGQ